MKTDRPVNLNLFPQPFAALVSISHRITGGALFVGIVFALYTLDLALSSPEGFAEAAALVHQPFPALIFFGLLFVLVFHIVAGFKHLLLDFHIGDTIQAAQAGAIAVVVVSLLVTLTLGALLW
ncbi:MAG: succinate dehydrogenase, cytochrome b556 subunit [Pseudomonadota bacterium]